MSGGWKDIVKNKWPPEKGSGTSLRSQVKGLVGRGDPPSSREEHVPTPRSALRDPSSFAPPPKHVAAYGLSRAQTQPADGTAPPIPARTASSQTWSAAAAQPAEEEPPAEPKPYRVNTTGLSTSHLPPPPTRSTAVGGRAPPPPPAYSQTPAAAAATIRTAAPAKPKAPPSLPPRLPPRSGNSTPSPTVASEPTASQGYLNQGAISSLGVAGISVPGLGIGGSSRTPPPPPPPGARPSPHLPESPAQAPGRGQVDELQARFARMGAGGDVADGLPPRSGQAPSMLGKKKPPPPPKPKKPELSGIRDTADTPPPIPLATRPRFD
ncbi:hypothetical protein F4802DRAFT_367913 [Xylaria palmicola]|nr:hypothetical protein F4802DRAFT_367913 [Xylaria palmicola]